MVRLSGLSTDRPSAAEAVGARYYATDSQVVYYSTGSAWLAGFPLDQSDAVAIRSTGPNPGQTKPDPQTCVGSIFIDDDGTVYEAFPTAWAVITLAGYPPT